MQESMQEEKEMTIKDIVLSLRKWVKYLLSKWIIIGAFALIGGIVGWCIFYFSDTKYVAESNFVLEGNSGNGQAGLGAALGLSGEATAGLFSSVNNIIWLYTSNNMLKQTLLTEVISEKGQKELLINRFRKTSKEIQKKIKKNPSLAKVQFSTNQEELSKEQEQFIRTCINVLKDQYLEIKSVEKTENIVNVATTAESEMFAYDFTKTLVGIVNDFYIKTKTQKTQLQVDQLSIKLDSLERDLNASMEYTASSVDDIPYANPNLSILRVESQRGNVDVQANTSMYLQVAQNLEVAKNELAKETPIIQIVDEPSLPLRKKKVGLIMTLGIGIILGILLPVIWLITRKVYLDLIN